VREGCGAGCIQTWSREGCSALPCCSQQFALGELARHLQLEAEHCFQVSSMHGRLVGVLMVSLWRFACCSTETFVEVQEGMEIDRGYISPQFVTNQVPLPVSLVMCAGACVEMMSTGADCEPQLPAGCFCQSL
jgi:hypothetical protein